MAQNGDTITYTYDGDLDANDDLIPEQEDVSAVDQMTIEYLDGAGGVSADGAGGEGGHAENVVVDIAAYDIIYIWVGSSSFRGRYGGGTSGPGNFGGGSTEIWFENTNQADSSDEPFIVGAGGGGAGGAEETSFVTGNPVYYGGSGGARGGGGGGSGTDNNGEDGEGVAPPLGGDGGDANSSSIGDGTDGAGAVNADLPEVIDSGTTTTGGGSAADTDGEVQISYALTIPDAPSNLSATLQ